MKRIKKLILTMFFMTLIGVGFKVDVKAEDIKPELLVQVINPDNNAEVDWGTSNAVLGLGIRVKKSYFPKILEQDGEYTATFEFNNCELFIVDGKTLADNIYFNLKSEKTTENTYKYTIDTASGSYTLKDDEDNVDFFFMNITKKDLKDKIQDGKNLDVINATVKATGEYNGWTTVPATGVTVENVSDPVKPSDGELNRQFIRKVSVTAHIGKSELTDVTIDGNGSYVLPNERITLEVTKAPSETDYRYKNWDIGAYSAGEIVESTKDKCTVDAGANSNYGIKVDLYYGSLSFVDPITPETLIVKKNEWSEQKRYQAVDFDFLYPREPKGVYYGLEGTGDKIPVADRKFYELKDGYNTFRFQLPPNTADGIYDLYIVMNNGEEYKYQFKVSSSSTEQWTITFDKNGGSGTMEPQTVNKGATATLKENTFTRSGYTFKNWNTKKDGSGTSYADKANITPTDDLTLYAQWDTSPTPTPGSTIMVTRGEMVLLHKDYKIPGVPTDYTNHITVKQSGTDYEIWGSKLTTSSKKGSITVSGKTYDVEVYDRPDLIWDFSTTSSSSTLTIEMPSSVYNDDGETFWDLDDVDVAAIIVSGQRRGTSKGWSYPLSGSGTTRTRKITLTELNSMINQVASGSEDIITIDLYPVDPYTGEIDYDVSDSESFTVYKVDLDGSHGANYKVNDKEVGDSFYAIDGVEYKISASNKNGYSSTIEKWEGVNFGTSTSGSTSFYGSKRIAAYFKSNTTPTPPVTPTKTITPPVTPPVTPPGGGGSNKDYDDVPKTGESKTDIWILWSVLFISILGAGFMIYKRFGLVKAIARAEEEAALVERQERVEAENKEKKEKMDLLKSLRDL